MLKTLIARLFEPTTALALICATSALSLVSAFIAQYGFGLLPCILCIYQRFPHGAAALIGAVFFFALKRNPKYLLPALLAVAAVEFTGGSIALFHTGVEAHWWHGTPACGVPDISAMDVQAIHEMLNSDKVVRCDVPAWTLFGVSMAGYNALMSMGMAAYASLTMIGAVRKARQT